MNAVSTPVPKGSTQTAWQIDPSHSAAHFSVRHLMISNVRGEFSKLIGTALIDAADPTNSTVDVTIEAGSVNTREPKRDEHLRSPDFFDVVNHPTITFRSKRVTADGPEHFKLTGDLTIRGVTRETTLDVEGPTPSVKDPWGNVRAGITATTKINRKDFGVAFNALTETGGLVVGDEVSISIEAELVQIAFEATKA